MWTVITATVLLALDLKTALAQEGTAPSASQIEEIIVTAERWEQAASTIGMSITTATDDVLQKRGVRQ
jgi:phenylacetate-coenzyme A ligase PaaK-like adenylate-forming protein